MPRQHRPIPAGGHVRRSRVRRGVVAVVVAVLALAVAGCGTAADPATPGTEAVYLSLGDSYATGFRATGEGTGATSDAFPNQVVGLLADAGEPVELLNLACTGTTSEQALVDGGCDPQNRAVAAEAYQEPQVERALAYVAENPGRVGLVTVVLGGNDVLPCLIGQGTSVPADWEECLEREVPLAAANLARIAERLRTALGDDVPIVGVGYPDLWLARTGDDPVLAGATLAAFRDVVDPSFREAFEAAGGSYVDLTAEYGGYDDPAIPVDVPGEGELSAPAAGICLNTYFCSDGDTHPTPEGHARTAAAVLAAAGMA